jgi:hypothetical protein
MRWSTRNLIKRQAAANVREAQRIAANQRNPRAIVENILSRASVCQQVAARMVTNPGDTQGAINFVAEAIGVPRETVLECLSIEALETGQ